MQEYIENLKSAPKNRILVYTTQTTLLEWLFQKMILKVSQALCIWRILEKFENSQKISFLFMKLVKISNDFKETVRVRKNSC